MIIMKEKEKDRTHSTVDKTREKKTASSEVEQGMKVGKKKKRGKKDWGAK